LGFDYPQFGLFDFRKFGSDFKFLQVLICSHLNQTIFGLFLFHNLPSQAVVVFGILWQRGSERVGRGHIFLASKSIQQLPVPLSLLESYFCFFRKLKMTLFSQLVRGFDIFFTTWFVSFSKSFLHAPARTLGTFWCLCCRGFQLATM